MVAILSGVNKTPRTSYRNINQLLEFLFSVCVYIFFTDFMFVKYDLAGCNLLLSKGAAVKNVSFILALEYFYFKILNNYIIIIKIGKKRKE